VHLCAKLLSVGVPNKEYDMALKRSLVAAFSILACLMFAWATGAGRPYPVSAGGVIDPACTTSLPCIEYDNNGTGPGIRGISINGNGLAGATKHISTSPAAGREGLIGNDISSSGSFNAGVRGVSVRGTGVAGQSTSGIGVTGSSSSSVGVEGVSSNSVAVEGVSSNSVAVEGVSSNSVGVLGESNISDAVRGVIGSGVASSFHAGVAGLDSSTSGATNQGVFGDTTFGIGVQGVAFSTGTGVEGSSPNGIGVLAVGGSSSTGLPALSVAGNGTAGDLLDACVTANPCDFFNRVFYVDRTGFVFSAPGVGGGYAYIDSGLEVGGATQFGSGDVNITGIYLKSNSCVAGCALSTAGSAGRAVTTYAPMVSQPTVEDFGEAQLVNGQASVRLDPKFANVVDQRANYLVFITPEGDANTLYVTDKSMGGFMVRESHSGRSTIAFSYRIVAKPFGSHEARLPMVDLPKLRSTSAKHRAWHPGRVVPVR
jgi:hypothetical protein